MENIILWRVFTAIMFLIIVTVVLTISEEKDNDDWIVYKWIEKHLGKKVLHIFKMFI